MKKINASANAENNLTEEIDQIILSNEIRLFLNKAFPFSTPTEENAMRAFMPKNDIEARTLKKIIAEEKTAERKQKNKPGKVVPFPG